MGSNDVDLPCGAIWFALTVWVNAGTPVLSPHRSMYLKTSVFVRFELQKKDISNASQFVMNS